MKHKYQKQKHKRISKIENRKQKTKQETKKENKKKHIYCPGSYYEPGQMSASQRLAALATCPP